MTGPRFTGGQYSLCRILLGAFLAVWTASRIEMLWTRPGASPLSLAALGAASACAVLLALGWHDRAAAAVLLALGVLLCVFDPALRGPALAPPGWLLAAHLLVPRAPYGSLDARGRPDPGGGWRLPRVVWMSHWVALLIGLILLVVPRPTSAGAGYLAGLVLVALCAFDPGWIAGRAGAAPHTLFYDGTCGLCHRAVRFLLAEDPDGRRFRFAPLQGARFRIVVDEARRRELPDSLVLLTVDGRVLTRWRAVREGLRCLGGYWAVLGWIGGLVPSPLGDAAYDLVARVRHRLFARPPFACPLTPPHLRERFILD